MRKFVNLNFLLIFLLVIFSCKKVPNYVLVDKFVDSTNAGEKGKTKIVAEKFLRNDKSECYIILNFYHKEKIIDYKTQKYYDKWYFDDRFYFDTTNIIGIDAELEDFNNDSFKDFTYHSFEAARGGNEVRKLFVYNPESKRFTYIKKSENFPNLFYNSRLDCINSLILTGSTSTYFLKIKKDTLYDFANVDVSDSIFIEERDETGKYKEIQKIKFTDSYEVFTPFINYKPLEQ